MTRAAEQRIADVVDVASQIADLVRRGRGAFVEDIAGWSCCLLRCRRVSLTQAPAACKAMFVTACVSNAYRYY